MLLIDTNVISEARKGERADAGVLAFWDAACRDQTPLFLASVTIGELRRGVEFWGRLRVPNPHNAIDKQIAAIALLHDLTVVTRNSDDFVDCGVRLLNPFQGVAR
ncbi:MAG: type II toxin-antitoxin system VapC family toxin [Synechococcaceae bacterium WB8_1B_136]|nr:type II toxin-antitoxin system VapC family toxin [Synechococcaceae bacterium WB8_1B_136]